jgi:hypothetical protein
LLNWKEGREGGRKEGRKGGRKEGGKEGRKEGRKEGKRSQQSGYYLAELFTFKVD